MSVAGGWEGERESCAVLWFVERTCRPPRETNIGGILPTEDGWKRVATHSGDLPLPSSPSQQDARATGQPTHASSSVTTTKPAGTLKRVRRHALDDESDDDDIYDLLHNTIVRAAAEDAIVVDVLAHAPAVAPPPPLSRATPMVGGV